MGAKPADTPKEQNHRLCSDQGELLKYPGMYRRLVGRLIYLTITRPDLAYAVGVLSQFMHSPRIPHLEAVHRILRYLKSSPGKVDMPLIDIFWFLPMKMRIGPAHRRIGGLRLDTALGGNLVTWKSKKQTVVARSSAEAEYRAMAHTACELIWLKTLLSELGVEVSHPIRMFCDNQAATHIASNPVFHERTKSPYLIIRDRAFSS